MTVQFKKIYRNINTELFIDEIRDLLNQHGITASDEKLQTYPLLNGATQSRVTITLVTGKESKNCGSIHIIGSSSGETEMIGTLDEQVISDEEIAALQDSINLVLESFEVKW
jgi:hypothetical protein